MNHDVNERDPGGSRSTVSTPDHRVEMYGGHWTALVPALVLIGILVWLSVEERAAISSFWVGGFAALIVGLFLARNKERYAQSIVRGMTDHTGAVIVLAFVFAGVFGKIMANGGLVSGLLWLGMETGLTGAAFTVLAFVLACLFAVGTGTSVGTVLALVPVLYPAGVYLGADPTWLAVALIAGGAFGDNLAPVSDTTITSAYTQGAEMGDVVRSRLPLSVTAAVISLVVLAIFGGGGEITTQTVDAAKDPLGLIMLIPFAVVIVLAMMRRHIIVSLTWGIVTAIALALITRLLNPNALFHIPEARGKSSGLIEDGIAGVTGVIVLILFIMALARIFADSGLMAAVLAKLEARAARGVRSAELTIVAVSVLFSIPLGANAPAIMLVGPTIAQPLGEDYHLSPQRRANLLDCSVCTVFYMLPWHNAVIVWFATVTAAASEYGLAAPSIGAAFLNPYAWGLLAVLLFSAITGWNRSFSRRDGSITRDARQAGQPVDNPT